MAEIDHSQVRLPRFLDPNEISQPPQERMTKLEAAMAELERVYAECATSQVQFMELIMANVQIQPTPFQSLKEEMAPKATSYTQLGFEKEQPKEEESMSIEELVTKYMKEQENMATISFKGQHESSPSTLGVNIEEEKRSTETPSTKITCPRKATLSNQNWDLLNLAYNLFSLRICKTTLRCSS